MSRFVFLIALFFLSCALLGAGKKRFVLYAMFTETTEVDVAEGGRWRMDKGDTFPVMMFKDQQTKIVLQLAGTSFMTETARVKVFEEKDLTKAQLATYRANVEQYLNRQAEKWKTEKAR